MNYASQYNPSRLNLDKASKYLQPNESFFLLNHDVNNPTAFGKGCPIPANHPACDLQLPAGENYAPNNYYSPLTNENYTWHYNSNNVHFISRINGDGLCEIVYEGSCLEISANPKHEITQFRALLDVDYLCNKVPGGALKRLIWVDGTETPMASLDVEAAIATNFFTTPFFNICPNPCSYIQMCVPEVDGCIQGEWVPYVNADKGKANLMLDKGFKFAIRQVYYDMRASEVSDRSTLFYQDAKGCFDNSEGVSRCIKFRIPIGNPQVEKIEFYFSENGGLIWFLADTIEKYKKYNSSQQYWYQRDLSEDVSTTYSASDCAFDYVFCNDKQRIPADPKLFTRVTNPIPREVQGLIRIKDTIAAYNYKVGTCPIDKNELDKIELEMNCANTTSCATEWANLTIRAVISNPFAPDTTAKVGYVYRSGGAVGAKDDLTDLAHFGFGIKGYEQVFTGEVRNFMPYIEGTNYVGEMVQWKSSPGFAIGNRIETGILSGVLSQDEIDRVNQDIANGNFFYQEYKFKVPRGMKGFVRIVSHYQISALGANQNTSTQVVGILPAGGLSTFTGTTIPTGYDLNVKEIEFDTCAGDVDNLDAFIISDIIYDTDEYAYSGYITDENSQPVAGARIYANGSYKSTTDFNGFYFFSGGDATVSITINVEQSCVSPFAQIDDFGASSVVKQMAHVDHEIDSESYADNFYANVDITVTDCNNSPVRGVRVAISGGKYNVTDSDGIAHFNIRNYYDRNRSVRAIIMDKNNCFSLDCFSNCNPCMPATVNTLLAPCFYDTPTYTIAPTTQLNIVDLIGNKRSLKKGGIYDMAFLVEGDCGQLSAAYKLKQFEVPKIQATGGFSVCTFEYNTNGAVFPTWAKKGKFLRSVNLAPYTLQWIVDEIDRTIDNKIILTIQSLNDYNKQYNFKTNTVYQYAKGDRVEFITNGDGAILDVATYGILNYQILSPYNDEVLSGVTDDVNFFNQIQIIDNGKLDNLEEGAIIEIQPLLVSSTNVTYYEMCANFDIVNGVPAQPIGIFEAFDTYLVNRQIGTFPPQYFEHKSPSDFWGETTIDGVSNFISDVGKAHFANPFENERRYSRNISINSATQMNYFGDAVKTLDAEEQGYITAISIVDDKIGLAICQNDNFLFQISDDFLRIGSGGVVIAAPADSIISNPEPKLVGQYGCLYQDIGSILFGDGYALWLDGQANTYIIHNYSFAKIAASYMEEGKVMTCCNSYFNKRNRQKEAFNKSTSGFLNHYRYSTGINKGNSVVYLTLKTLRLPGINNSQSVYAEQNETIMYHPAIDSFLGFVSFTCEGYSQLSLDTDGGCAFLTFQNSIPFIHELNPTKWNEFYGISVDWCIGVCLNKFPDKQKIALSIEEQAEKFFFVSKVETDKPNFLSEIPPIRFKNGMVNKWNASFLNNINSRGGLYNGDNCRGFEINVLFTRNNSLNLAYGTINDSLRQEFSTIDNILIKFQVQEQSGFTENL